MEFDQAGELVQAWGPIHGEKGELLGKQAWGPYPDVEWPLYEHGIFVERVRRGDARQQPGAAVQVRRRADVNQLR